MGAIPTGTKGPLEGNTQDKLVPGLRRGKTSTWVSEHCVLPLKRWLSLRGHTSPETERGAASRLRTGWGWESPPEPPVLATGRGAEAARWHLWPPDPRVSSTTHSIAAIARMESVFPRGGRSRRRQRAGRRDRREQAGAAGPQHSPEVFALSCCYCNKREEEDFWEHGRKGGGRERRQGMISRARTVCVPRRDLSYLA